MRKFSAHRICPVTSPPVPFGIVETDDDGTVIRIRETGGNPAEEAGLEFYSGLIVPGFINAHCHLELSHLKGLVPQHTGLTGFITAVRDLRASESVRIIEAARSHDQRMFAEGISAVGDICNTTDTAEIKKSSPIRYHNFIELFGLDPATSQIRFDKALLSPSSFLLSTLSPHSPYSTGITLWELLRAHPELTGRISIHHAEGPEEKELLEVGTGPLADSFRRLGFDLSQIPALAKNVFSLLDEYLPGSQTLLVHNLSMETDNLQLSRITRHESRYFVLCPNSNLYIHNQAPDFMGFAESGLTICLGTDSLAANQALSVLGEMKTIQQVAPDLPFETLLRWGTLNGARALGMERELGSIESGKRPGLVNISGFNLRDGRVEDNSLAARLI